ncbi:MAG: OmpA family protein [Telmatospirillum sp.]|nr:OmpA family protein [Telmatospirillum sp.]
MQFRVFSTAMVLLLAATSAHAQKRPQYLDGLYVSGQAGLNKTEESGTSRDGVTTKAGFAKGATGSVAVGYGLGNGLRGELEGALRQSTVNSLQNSYVVDDGTGVLSTVNPGPGGRVRTLSVMGNVIYDVPTSVGVTPFAGVGVGGARVEMNNFGPDARVAERSATTSGSKIVPAYQALAGVNVGVTDNVSVGVTYRYFATDKVSIASDAGTPTKFTIRDHSVMAGLTWAFNAPTTSAPNAMANVAVVPSAAQPQQQSMTAGTPQLASPAFSNQPQVAAVAPAAAAGTGPRAFTVFFEFDKAAISGDADRVLVQAAETAKSGVFTRIRATGHTDTVGTARYNMALSIRRANAVRDVLVREGIPATQIVVVGRGETQLLVPTPDNINEPRNRRVEIVIE